GAAVLGLAGWTLLAQACTALGLSLLALELTAAAAVALAVTWRLRTRRDAAPATPSAPPPSPPSCGVSGLRRFLLTLVAATAVVWAFRVTGSPWVLCLGGSTILAVGLALR